VTVRRTLQALASAILLSAAACSNGSAAGNNVAADLARLVVQDPPSGFAAGPAEVNRRYTRSMVARTSPAPSSQAGKLLGSAGFQAAWGRVFTAPTGFAVLVLMQVADDKHALTLAQSETKATLRLPGTAGWSPVFVPHASGYLFNGKLSGAVSYCQGVWVAVAIDVIHAYTCSDQPGTVDVLEALVTRQYQLLTGSAAG
jgi:hypothetical protein